MTEASEEDKKGSKRNYKKSSVLDDVYEGKDKDGALKSEG